MKTYTIMKLQDGGYVIQERGNTESGVYHPLIFACTKIGEALEYIREHMEKPNAP